MNRKDYRCPECGSRDVIRNATARWNLRHQVWDVAEIEDIMTCLDCCAEGMNDDFERKDFDE